MSVYVVAFMKPAEGKIEEVGAGLKELAAAVKENEPGCIQYDVIFAKEHGSYTVFEVYKDMEAVAAHKEAAHVKEAFAQAAESLADPPMIAVVDKIAGFHRH
ncbi:hypothetical protein K402DRAFT_467223 [Aulographum hederae CBS 113979]|uniref:ABM domain-containing protein n=1 Tax=Aulographum hederae CBS 113979 TaxID=1176131 RepID=A0A6G1GMA1_9PEZI|nr:hypothetical protein K402DRAFT_467223 [Aulographum hederae CBS 113979]